MFDATTTKNYDFWYYQSLLEEPYTNLQEYCNKQAWIREIESYTVFLVEGEEENKKAPKTTRGTKWN